MARPPRSLTRRPNQLGGAHVLRFSQEKEAAASRRLRATLEQTARRHRAFLQARLADARNLGSVTRRAGWPDSKRASRPPRRFAPGSHKDAATAHELAPGWKLARRRGASLKARLAARGRAGCGFWLSATSQVRPASVAPVTRRARLSLKGRPVPHAARRVPPLSAPLPAVAPPDNAHVIGSGALGLAGTRALQVAARLDRSRVVFKGALFTESPSVNLARDPLLAVGWSAAPRNRARHLGLALRPQPDTIPAASRQATPRAPGLKGRAPSLSRSRGARTAPATITTTAPPSRSSHRHARGLASLSARQRRRPLPLRESGRRPGRGCSLRPVRRPKDPPSRGDLCRVGVRTVSPNDSPVPFLGTPREASEPRHDPVREVGPVRFSILRRLGRRVSDPGSGPGYDWALDWKPAARTARPCTEARGFPLVRAPRRPRLAQHQEKQGR
jgi:hypothetical protein